jgi:hypothetical protein
MHVETIQIFSFESLQLLLAKMSVLVTSLYSGAHTARTAGHKCLRYWSNIIFHLQFYSNMTINKMIITIPGMLLGPFVTEYGHQGCLSYSTKQQGQQMEQQSAMM